MVFSDNRSKRKKLIELRNCIVCNKIIPRNTKQGQKRIRPAQYVKAKFCSKKCRGYWQRENLKGIKNPNYKNGDYIALNIFRNTPEYKEWRIRIFIRDNFTCQSCKKRGGNLEVHHIKPAILYKELILEMSNGITLCKECHKLTDSYGIQLRRRKNINI